MKDKLHSPSFEESQVTIGTDQGRYYVALNGIIKVENTAATVSKHYVVTEHASQWRIKKGISKAMACIAC